MLAQLHDVASVAGLGQRYYVHDGEWGERDVAVPHRLDEEQPVALRRIEVAAYGLGWLELEHGRHFNLCGSP